MRAICGSRAEIQPSTGASRFEQVSVAAAGGTLAALLSSQSQPVDLSIRARGTHEVTLDADGLKTGQISLDLDDVGRVRLRMAGRPVVFDVKGSAEQFELAMEKHVRAFWNIDVSTKRRPRVSLALGRDDRLKHLGWPNLRLKNAQLALTLDTRDGELVFYNGHMELRRLKMDCDAQARDCTRTGRWSRAEGTLDFNRLELTNGSSNLSISFNEADPDFDVESVRLHHP